MEYRLEGISVVTSNLCSEITLRTDEQHSGVCCLASINLEYWYEYENQLDSFLADCSDFLDNILQDFINQSKDAPGFEKSRRAAIDERSIGLGVMGLHSLFQSRKIPFESPMAKGLNTQIFKRIKESVDKHQSVVGATNPCPMAQRHGTKRRNIHVTAVAPTMSISSLCNVCSSGIEPWVTNYFTKKVKQGSFAIKNKYLDFEMRQYAAANKIPNVEEWVELQWQIVKKAEGSVQGLEWMDEYLKEVFKTAFEISQEVIVHLAADRAPLIDQSQSLNIFIPSGSHVQFISDIHILAWRLGVKSLYYLRSNAGHRATTSLTERKTIKVDLMSDTCPACG